jgi:molybdopterin/thiamine biosynthesis adenylyltransferase
MPDPMPKGFTEQELDYYSRQIVLREFGLEGQRKLKKAKVCVVGAGGLGSPILTQLASMGVGTLRVIDRDVVEASNLQRQHLYGMHQLGLPKVEAAEDRLHQINPFIAVEPVPLSVTHGNAERLIEGSDVVVDGLDSMAARYAVNKACQRKGTPFVHGAVIMQVGTASTIIPGETACLECFQGGIHDADLPSCAVQGVHPSVISLIASVQVSETIRLLLGEPPILTDKLLFADLKELTIEKVQLARAENCPVCSGHLGPVETEPGETHVEEICGREGRRVWIFSPEYEMDIDLEEINDRLDDLGYTIIAEGRLGASFMHEKVKGSVLASGVTVIEGVKDREAAENLRDRLLR